MMDGTGDDVDDEAGDPEVWPQGALAYAPAALLQAPIEDRLEWLADTMHQAIPRLPWDTPFTQQLYCAASKFSGRGCDGKQLPAFRDMLTGIYSSSPCGCRAAYGTDTSNKQALAPRMDGESAADFRHRKI